MPNRLTEAELDKCDKRGHLFIQQGNFNSLLAMARTLLACEKALSAERAEEMASDISLLHTFEPDGICEESLREYAAALEREQ